MPMSITAETALSYLDKRVSGMDGVNRRGLTVYSATELLGIAGRDERGELLQSQYEQPIFSLTVDERLDIFRYCADVFGVVASRMHRIAGLEWQVRADSKEEDRIAASLKDSAQIYKEYEGILDLKYLVVRKKLFNFISKRLPDVLPDLSNFDASLSRWVRKGRTDGEDRSEEIQEWLKEPSQGTDIMDFMKMWIFDLMIHGGTAVYKEVNDKRIENFYNLPGGTVHPLKNRYVGGANPYVQVIDGEEPQIFFDNEMSYTKYVPTSAKSHGMIPLEALINKVSESMLFDRKAAMEADGTRPPEKLIVFGDNAPFGGLDQEFEVPINKDEQIRIESAINEAKKEAIRTLTGVGTPVAVDLSRSDQFPHHMERQRQIREYVGLVFQASNIEMNLTGSDDTSGRATSESQERIDKQKGIWPIVLLMQDFFSQDIIPYRFGPGYAFEFSPGQSEAETVKLVKDKLQSGAWSINEVRSEDLAMDPFQGEEYDLPQGGGPADPGMDEDNPIFTQGVGE